MGFFSFLKKKNEAPASSLAAPPRSTETSAPGSPLPDSPPGSPLISETGRERQRDIARATAAKIDAIELEMTTDMFADTEAAWGSARRAPAAAAAVVEASLETELISVTDLPDAAAAPASAPVVEESAILYANGQAELAEQILLGSLAGLGPGERQPWWMLFDLYQAQGREADFENIAIDYASHIETSPPAYTGRAPHDTPAAAWTGVAPSARFTGLLGADAAPRLQALLASGAAPVQFDFSGVAGASIEGCAALLATLRGLRAHGREVVLAGSDTLIGVLRPMLAIGEPAGGAAPWLLLLELLQGLGREKDFEETAMDYCVTFEVSPPAFEASAAPANAATAAATAAAPALAVAGPVPGCGAASEQRFVLPPLIDGDIGPLLAALGAYADADPAQAVLLDCSRLARISFGAATALHASLCRLAANGRRVELRDLNHLVAALLRLLNYSDCTRLYAHKY